MKPKEAEKNLGAIVRVGYNNKFGGYNG